MSFDISLEENGPGKFLDALDNYRGHIYDLDSGETIAPIALRDGWKKLVRRFGEFGLCPGDRVIVAVSNGPLFIAVWGAILVCGGSPVPVHFETPPAELNRIACRFHAATIVTDRHRENEMEAAESHAYSMECSSWGRLVWTDVYADGRNPGIDATLQLPGIPLHPTSGTTGDPKLAVRPMKTAIAEIDNYVNTFGIDADDTILGMTPMSHAFANGFCAIGPIMTGCNLAIMKKFRPELIASACSGLDVTIIAAVAGVLDTLLFMGGAALKTSIRKIFSGGGPLSERTARQFQKVAGIVPRPLYGATETGGIAVAGDGELCIDGRIGRAFDGVSIELADFKRSSEHQNEHEMSMIRVHSKSLMVGYLIDEELDTSIIRDGWYDTGDLGRMDSDGYLYLCGREAEVINVSGMKVLPREVEEVILGLRSVREVKVFGHRNRTGAYQIRAAVVGDGLSIEDIHRHCREQLVYYKRPAKIITLESLPKNANGKVLLSKLAELVQGELS